MLSKRSQNSYNDIKPSIMKIIHYHLLLLVSIMLPFPFLQAASKSTQENFLHCLREKSNISNHPISAAIFTPTNSSFSSVLRSYAQNLRFASLGAAKPVAVIAAMHESHVQAAVSCARAHGLLIKTRSGGHDYEGLSYQSNVPFVLLDLFNLRSIDIDLKDESLWVQSGAVLGEIYYNIAAKSKNHGFPAGVCPTIGAGGHFAAGGYGNMVRKYGLSVDNIVDARLVDVEGRILDRKSMGEDLFWAIRGGGASFGIVLSWKLKLVAVPNPVTVFRVDRTIEEGATELVYQWQNVAAKLPKDLFIRLEARVINGSGVAKKTVKVSFVAIFLGQAGKLVELMKERFPALGLKRADCKEMPWIESTLFWDNVPEGTSTRVLLDRKHHKKDFVKIKSDYVLEPISKSGLESIWKKMIELEKIRLMQWNPYGGRMSEISVSETPFPHRDALFKIQYVVFWNEESLNASKKYVKVARKFHGFMAPYVSKNPRRAFFPYRDIDVGSSPSCNATYEEAKGGYGWKYFESNFDSLVLVKTKYDRTNFFRNEQSIPPLRLM